MPMIAGNTSNIQVIFLQRSKIPILINYQIHPHISFTDTIPPFTDSIPYLTTFNFFGDDAALIFVQH